MLSESQIIEQSKCADGVLKGIPVNVYSAEGYRQCANGGISQQHDQVLMVCPEGFLRADQSAYPVVRTVVRNIRGEYRHAAECDIYGNLVTKDDKCGPMFGGSFVYTSDSRFRENLNAYPLALHDRFE